MDKELRPLEGLRTHLAKYFGEVVASAMEGGSSAPSQPSPPPSQNPLS